MKLFWRIYLNLGQVVFNNIVKHFNYNMSRCSQTLYVTSNHYFITFNFLFYFFMVLLCFLSFRFINFFLYPLLHFFVSQRSDFFSKSSNYLIRKFKFFKSEWKDSKENDDTDFYIKITGITNLQIQLTNSIF